MGSIRFVPRHTQFDGIAAQNVVCRFLGGKISKLYNNLRQIGFRVVSCFHDAFLAAKE